MRMADSKIAKSLEKKLVRLVHILFDYITMEFTMSIEKHHLGRWHKIKKKNNTYELYDLLLWFGQEMNVVSFLH